MANSTGVALLLRTWIAVADYANLEIGENIR